ncbi:RsiV family protein [Acidaminobacterium chupaoyuni]
MPYQEENGWKSGALEGTLYYGRTPVLGYRIAYPQPAEAMMPGSARRMREYYKTRACEKLAWVKQQIYPQAAEACRRLGKTEGFRMPQLTEEFTPMYCGGGMCSLFFDTYLAGCTGRDKIWRFAQTWDIWQKRTLPLAFFFRRGFAYRSVILQEIGRQVERQSREEGSLYYRDAEKLLKTKFSEERFYLADDGIVIFYEQRALGRSALGIPSFLIPYTQFGSGLKPEL